MLFIPSSLAMTEVVASQSQYVGAVLDFRVADASGDWWIFRANKRSCPTGEYRAATLLSRFGIKPFVPSRMYKLLRTQDEAFAPAMMGWVFGLAESAEQVVDAIDEDYKLRGQERYILTKRRPGDQWLCVQELSVLQELAESGRLGGGERKWVPGKTRFEVVRGNFEGQECVLCNDTKVASASVVCLLVKTMSRLVEVDIPVGDVEVIPEPRVEETKRRVRKPKGTIINS